MASVYWRDDYLRMYNGGYILKSVYTGKCVLKSVQYIGEVPAGERMK